MIAEVGEPMRGSRRREVVSFVFRCAWPGADALYVSPTITMPDIAELLEEIRLTPGWQLDAPAGLPSLPCELELPPDLRQVYEAVGGCVAYEERVCSPTRIVGPEEFQRIELAISGETIPDAPSEYWYAIADVANGNYLAIDLHPRHKGFCYDCFHETFHIPGEVRIIASSFTDLLHRLLRHREDSAFWLEDGFQWLGEAYPLYGYEAEG